ncbi:MAG TPA: Hsp33 family molecular chaperone HslO [Thermoanaerobaculia bacterium]|nr:Hsp33 family molecular chaperone HslO [Thermoanaerobaculia bacterium]
MSTLEPGSEREGILEVGLAAGGRLRWAAADITAVVEEARIRLDLSPLATVAFGRCAAAAVMLHRLALKTPARLDIDVRGDGPVGRVLVEVRDDGGLRGLVSQIHAVGENGPQDLRVGPGIGRGLLRVRREDQSGRRYESQVELVTGEIGVDVAHYLEQSEQRQSAVMLGVLASPDGVEAAGGLLIEAMPDAERDLVSRLERSIGEFGSVSRVLDRDGLEGSVSRLLGDLEAETVERREIRYQCQCRREGLADSLGVLDRQQLVELVSENGAIDAECAYCGQVYHFDLDELDGDELTN